MAVDPTDNEAGHSQHTESMVRLAKLWSSAIPSVEAFVSASVRDIHDREDLIQATGEYLARNFSQYQEGTSFVGWAITVARFRMLEMWRDRSRDKLVLNTDAIDAVAAAAIESQDEISDRQEALSKCIHQLAGDHRRLLEWRYMQGLKPAVIAERVGKSPNTISAALFRIRSALKRCVETRLGVTADDPAGGV